MPPRTLMPLNRYRPCRPALSCRSTGTAHAAPHSHAAQQVPLMPPGTLMPLNRWQGFLILCAGILKQSMGARNRTGIGLSYRTSRLHSLTEFVPRHRFLGLLKKFGFCALILFYLYWEIIRFFEDVISCCFFVLNAFTVDWIWCSESASFSSVSEAIFILS